MNMRVVIVILIAVLFGCSSPSKTPELTETATPQSTETPLLIQATHSSNSSTITPESTNTNTLQTTETSLPLIQPINSYGSLITNRWICQVQARPLVEFASLNGGNLERLKSSLQHLPEEYQATFSNSVPEPETLVYLNTLSESQETEDLWGGYIQVYPELIIDYTFDPDFEFPGLPSDNPLVIKTPVRDPPHPISSKPGTELPEWFSQISDQTVKDWLYAPYSNLLELGNASNFNEFDSRLKSTIVDYFGVCSIFPQDTEQRGKLENDLSYLLGIANLRGIEIEPEFMGGTPP